jgi:hypothetical protein
MLAFSSTLRGWRVRSCGDENTLLVAARRSAVADNLTGFNVDWEPTDKNATEDDAIAYANFLTTFADALHSQGILVNVRQTLTPQSTKCGGLTPARAAPQVDLGSWSPLWDWALLSASSADTLYVMSTYTDNDASFTAALERAQEQIDPAKLCIGLQTVRDSSGLPYNVSELAFRFDALANANVQCACVWDAPIPDMWWPFLDSFAPQ